LNYQRNKKTIFLSSILMTPDEDLVQQLVAFVAVGFLWGATNPWLKRGSEKMNSPERRQRRYVGWKGAGRLIYDNLDVPKY
jgi:hypothetical protein